MSIKFSSIFHSLLKEHFTVFSWCWYIKLVYLICVHLCGIKSIFISKLPIFQIWSAFCELFCLFVCFLGCFVYSIRMCIMLVFKLLLLLVAMLCTNEDEKSILQWNQTVMLWIPYRWIWINISTEWLDMQWCVNTPNAKCSL